MLMPIQFHYYKTKTICLAHILINRSKTPLNFWAVYLFTSYSTICNEAAIHDSMKDEVPGKKKCQPYLAIYLRANQNLMKQYLYLRALNSNPGLRCDEQDAWWVLSGGSGPL